MRTPSLRTRRIAALAAGPLAIVLAGGLVWQGSTAAFSADTRNIGNNWETGSVALSDDDLGAAMFQIADVLPMQTGSKCIVVTSTASVPGVVKTYVANLASSGLEDNIILTIESGSGGSFNSCTGFVADAGVRTPDTLAGLALDHDSYDNGDLPWTITGDPAGEHKTYRFTWTFDTTGLTQVQIDTLQGKSASINFEWELQNL